MTPSSYEDTNQVLSPAVNIASPGPVVGPHVSTSVHDLTMRSNAQEACRIYEGQWTPHVSRSTESETDEQLAISQQRLNESTDAIATLKARLALLETQHRDLLLRNNESRFIVSQLQDAWNQEKATKDQAIRDVDFAKCREHIAVKDANDRAEAMVKDAMNRAEAIVMDVMSQAEAMVKAATDRANTLQEQNWILWEQHAKDQAKLDQQTIYMIRRTSSERRLSDRMHMKLRSQVKSIRKTLRKQIKLGPKGTSPPLGPSSSSPPDDNNGDDPSNGSARPSGNSSQPSPPPRDSSKEDDSGFGSSDPTKKPADGLSDGSSMRTRQHASSDMQLPGLLESRWATCDGWEQYRERSQKSWRYGAVKRVRSTDDRSRSPNRHRSSSARCRSPIRETIRGTRDLLETDEQAQSQDRTAEIMDTPMIDADLAAGSSTNFISTNSPLHQPEIVWVAQRSVPIPSPDSSSEQHLQSMPPSKRVDRQEGPEPMQEDLWNQESSSPAQPQVPQDGLSEKARGKQKVPNHQDSSGQALYSSAQPQVIQDGLSEKARGKQKVSDHQSPPPPPPAARAFSTPDPEASWEAALRHMPPPKKVERGDTSEPMQEDSWNQASSSSSRPQVSHDGLSEKARGRQKVPNRRTPPTPAALAAWRSRQVPWASPVLRKGTYDTDSTNPRRGSKLYKSGLEDPHKKWIDGSIPRFFVSSASTSASASSEGDLVDGITRFEYPVRDIRMAVEDWRSAGDQLAPEETGAIETVLREFWSFVQSVQSTASQRALFQQVDVMRLVEDLQAWGKEDAMMKMLLEDALQCARKIKRLARKLEPESQQG